MEKTVDLHQEVVLPSRVEEYGQFSKDLLRPQKTLVNATELINTLGTAEQGLSAINRDIERDDSARIAARDFDETEGKIRKLGILQIVGWRTDKFDVNNNPVNESFTSDDARKKREALESVRENAKKILQDFIQKRHGYVFRVLHDALGSNQDYTEDLDDYIISGIARINRSKKKGLYPDIGLRRQEIIKNLASYFVDKSSKFRYLKSLLNPTEGSNDLFGGLHDALIDSHLQEEVARISEMNRIFDFRQWLITTGQKALIGERDPTNNERKLLKVYPTPYYENLLRAAEFLGRKENGIGGSIYTGPPGTGKTRLSVLSNQEEGFDTRVIQIHHYSTFLDLIGERTVQLGLDKSTSYQQRLEATKNWLKQDPEKAVQGLRDFYFSKRANGKVLEESFEDFMKNYIVTDKEDEINFNNNQEISKGFERYLDYQMAGASLGLETGNVIDEWVNGELILAMSQGKRAMLDELDKAGPYSLGGLLTLLSLSPGEKFTVGNKTITIPSWFRVDATANVLSLSRGNSDQAEGKTKEYLYDRFNVIPVDYPPIKDDLMIAAVRLSDGAGNLKITPEEQWQIIGIYSHIIPALRSAYKSNTDMAPVSHRLTAELCSFLVNPQTKERTTVSVEQALNLALSKIQSLSNSNREEVNAVKEITQRYFELYQKSSERPYNKPKPKLTPQPVSAIIVDSALASLLQSPLMRAIANYQTESVPFSEEKIFQLMELNPQQQAKIQEEIITNREHEVQSDLGFKLDIRQNKDGYRFTLMGDDLAFLTSSAYSFESEPIIHSISTDARTALIKTKDNKYYVIKPWKKNSFEQLVLSIPDQYKNIQMSSDGKYVIANGEKSAIYVCPTENVTDQNKWRLLKDYESNMLRISGDGAFLLTEDIDRKHSRIFDLKRLVDTNPNAHINADLLLEGGSYDFVSPNLIIKNGTNQAILIYPKTNLELWMNK